MAKSKFSVAANAGFAPFSLYDLQQLWTNLRDGNYWSAFRIAISILNNAVNAQEGITTAHPWDDSTGEQIDDVCRELENWRDGMSRTVATKVVKVKPQGGEPGVDAIPLPEILSLITMVLQMLRDWRKRRSEPTPPQGVTGAVPTFPGQPGTAAPKPLREPIFPAHVEVTDKGTAQPKTGSAETPVNPEGTEEHPKQAVTTRGNPPVRTTAPVVPPVDTEEGEGDTTSTEEGDTPQQPAKGTAENPANLSGGDKSDAVKKMENKPRGIPPRK